MIFRNPNPKFVSAGIFGTHDPATVARPIHAVEFPNGGDAQMPQNRTRFSGLRWDRKQRLIDSHKRRSRSRRTHCKLASQRDLGEGERFPPRILFSLVVVVLLAGRLATFDRTLDLLGCESFLVDRFPGASVLLVDSVAHPRLRVRNGMRR